LPVLFLFLLIALLPAFRHRRRAAAHRAADAPHTRERV
jgi:hypothetical protein